MSPTVLSATVATQRGQSGFKRPQEVSAEISTRVCQDGGVHTGSCQDWDVVQAPRKGPDVLDLQALLACQPATRTCSKSLYSMLILVGMCLRISDRHFADESFGAHVSQDQARPTTTRHPSSASMHQSSTPQNQSPSSGRSRSEGNLFPRAQLAAWRCEARPPQQLSSSMVRLISRVKGTWACCIYVTDRKRRVLSLACALAFNCY